MIQKLQYVLLFITLLLVNAVMGQTITGTVTDDFGVPLPGVNVVEKGTTNGTSADFDGNYTIEVSSSSATLVFTFIGFETKEIVVGDQTTINVAMDTDTEMLGEVVVTALGIKKEKKAVGYAVQEIAGTDLLEARETNLVNAFSGKVSGMQVIRGSNGPASSSRIVLRGNNSLTGDNQPLIVVDGIPINNFTGADENGFFNPSADLGNGLGDINPDDIESMTVLKGASAAALYGNRAGNGVILITTKTGTARKGLGITFSSTVGFQNVFLNPELQNSFGQGNEGIYDDEDTQSWGPRADGQLVEDWKGDMVPFVPRDNLGSYYNGGFSQNYGLSFQQQLTNGTSLYASLNYLEDEGVIPNANFERLNFTTRAVTNYGPKERWTTDIKIQYNRASALNRPIGGENIRNVSREVIALPRTVNLLDFRDPSVDEFGNMIWFLPSNSVNPWWAADFNINEDSRDRFLLNGSLKYKINDWITAELKGGADLFTNNTESRQFAGSPLSPNGRYSLGKDTFIEENYMLLVTGSKSDILGKLGLSFTAGGNLMQQRSEGLFANAGELEVPNLFTINNGINPATVRQEFAERKINSLFGSIGLDYDGILFVDLTGRNDWTSTLSSDNRSFFYPSVNTSFVFSELLNSNSKWFSFGKIRASYAEVGNDLDPFELQNIFTIGQDVNGNTTAGTNNIQNNPDLVNELIKSTEVGLETRFFNNRIVLDMSYYKTNATNQLLAIPIDPFSGFNQRRVNAGDVQNEGFEIAFNASIFENPDGFSWNTNVNFARNVNTVVELTDDVNQFTLGNFDNLSVRAVAGGSYGEIWGTRFRRVEDETDPNFGRLVVDGDGLPLQAADNETFFLGDQQPDALIGWSNTFAYKNWSLGFLIDASLGGDIFSNGNRFLQRSGNAAATVVNGQREDIVVDAVVDDGTGNFVENTVGVSPQLYYTALANRSGNLGIGEAFMYDATHVRLRNVTLNYVFNPKLLKGTGLQGAKLGLTANNVWMITHHLNGIDPESVFAAGTNATGFENLSPPTVRSLFFNISLSF
ncbi:SusC/RagA family TonB-linked outer membrane protein [Ulvibacterium sp.]|uniref:SusC/RagA family TonB-linked outer membrane protein n=1 Tax=Ulvibacterium sp. TaxID=2665914 RepID=UPI003BAB8297